MVENLCTQRGSITSYGANIVRSATYYHNRTNKPSDDPSLGRADLCCMAF